MHIFFSGIGGVGIGPLALMAKQAGYEVSGSDVKASQYLEYLKTQGITNISVGQSTQDIATLHSAHPIDWYVYSSAVKDDNPELVFARERRIKTSKRDEFTNKLISEKNLKLIAIAGTHGKTTTTAMVVWLFKGLRIPVSYSLGAKLSFGDMGHYEPDSEYFVYECDEFDRNFLAFKPFVAIISGVAYDHHEIYPTRHDYQQAFRDFIEQSEWIEIWQEDKDYLELEANNQHAVMDSSDPDIEKIKLAGRYNRLDGWLAVKAVRQLTQEPLEKILEIIDKFPGLHRRMEQIAPGLYSDEAHTPDKIRGCMSAALELAESQKRKSLMDNKEKLSTASESYKRYGERGAEAMTQSDAKRTLSGAVVVVYEPLTNRRQHYMKDDYKDCFNGAKKVYWLPSYLAREDPDQEVLPPSELIKNLADPSVAEARERDDELKTTIQEHLKNGDMVVGMAGGGGDSLDEWLRANFVRSSK